MLTRWKDKVRFALTTVTGFAPWLAAMYLLYWFEASQTWTTETEHRDILTIVILVLGMGLSFLVLSYFSKRGQR